jgi:small subunit ribosomal protein S1
VTPPNDGDEDFASLLAEFDDKQKAGRGPKVGDTVKGRVISVGAESVFVDLGGKAEGMLEITELTDKSGNVTVKVGDMLEARVVDLGARSGCILLRKVMGSARGAEAKTELLQAHEHQIPIEGLVTGVVKGGVEVQIAGTRGFCPAGQLDTRFVEDQSIFVGQRLTFRITRLETGRAGQLNLVLSRRVLLAEEAEVRANELRKHLEVGAVLPGTVTTIKDYGAFVDLGGIEGMLHVSELGFQRVGHPSEVLSVGQPVQVQVTKIEKTGDAKRPEKISLSLKALEKDPWTEAASRYTEGQRVRGRVVRLQPFGAFVELEPGIEGLVHISQLAADRRINNPREVVTVDQDVEVTIVGVEPDRRRISLSLTAQSAAEAADEAADFAAVRAGAERGLGTLGDIVKKRLQPK